MRGKLVLAGKRGKPYKAVVHIAFEDLLAMQGASALLAAYTGQVTGTLASRAASRAAARTASRARDAQARWTGHRAADQVTGGGDGGTWLTGQEDRRADRGSPVPSPGTGPRRGARRVGTRIGFEVFRG